MGLFQFYRQGWKTTLQRLKWVSWIVQILPKSHFNSLWKVRRAHYALFTHTHTPLSALPPHFSKSIHNNQKLLRRVKSINLVHVYSVHSCTVELTLQIMQLNTDFAIVSYEGHWSPSRFVLHNIFLLMSLLSSFCRPLRKSSYHWCRWRTIPGPLGSKAQGRGLCHTQCII